MIMLNGLPVSSDVSPLATVHRLPQTGKRDRLDAFLDHQGDRPYRLTLSSVAPSPVSLSETVLERHPFSTQTFLPMNVSRWLVMVAASLPDGAPDLTQVRALVLGPQQAVTYAIGAWHLGVKAFDRPASFGVLMWRDDLAGNDEFLELTEALHVRI